ncbi:MAG TPA: hypothetical protein VFJ98_05270 [Mycobacteriales bacterium]|nr:hypothetical protein [Mycobacteriales bacterium]
MTDHLGDHPPVDEISQESGLGVAARPLPRPSVSRGARLTALSTALAVVLAGGVVTAAWRAFEPHHAAEELVPASAFAVGTIDLSLPAGQADALSAFADRFPGSPTHHGDGSAVDRLLRAIFRTSSDPHVDYDRDVKPWLGDHAAIAGWMDHGKPQLEVLLESTDDGSARRHLTTLMQGDGAVEFADGYAVLGDNDRAVRDAIAAAHSSSLADDRTYVGDVDALPGHPAVTGWMDGPAVMRAVKSTLSPGEARMFDRMSAAGPFGMLGPLGMTGLAGAGSGAAFGGARAFAGRTAVGIRVDDRYVELDSRSTGAGDSAGASTAQLRRLPATTIAAVELADPGKLVTGVTSMVGSFLSIPSGPLPEPGLASGGSSTGCVVVPPVRPRAIPRNAPHRREILREMRLLRRQARQGHNHPCDFPRPLRLPKPPDPMAQIKDATGLSLPGDATTVLGDSLLASYGGLGFDGVPKVALRTHPADLSAAERVMSRVQGKVAAATGLQLAVEPSGDDLVVATSQDYEHAVEQEGSLADQALARLALGSVPDAVASAGYVDLSKILPLLGSGIPRDVQALKAIGFWTAAPSGGVQLSQLRVVVG